MALEHKFDGSDIPQKDHVVARGPAISRYDEANDTTFAVFLCAHGHCHTAVQLKGNQTGAVLASAVLLTGNGWATRELQSPIPVNAQAVESAFNVTSVVAAAVQQISAAPYLVGVHAGITLSAAGVGLQRRSPHAWGVGIFALAALAGSVAAHMAQASGALGAGLFVLPIAVLMVLFAMVFLVASRWWKPAATVAVSLLLLAAGAAISTYLISDYYPACCIK